MNSTASSSKRVFRPRLIPTLVMLPFLVTLLGLGTWQLERRVWKLGLIADMEERLAMPPAPLSELLPLGPAAAYRPVFAVGVYAHGNEMPLMARTYRGKNGEQIVTPLLLTERGAGVDSVLVNRGWVPEAKSDPKTRPESQPGGETVATGILRWPSTPGTFTPDNDPARNQWYWTDVHAMAEAADLSRPAPVVIDVGPNKADPKALPIGGQTIIDLPNDHLQYAITWFALAAVLLATYILSQRRPLDAPSSD
ncbi:MAG TPA: SURF1 family protein [Alphaproteobacteria bacterium]|jgi:surfeit locus 1 family protein